MGNDRPVVRRATLHKEEFRTVPQELVQPLFNPEVIRIDARGVLMVGYEIHSEGTGAGRKLAEHIQAWLWKPVFHTMGTDLPTQPPADHP